jgi:hypothetical protein
MNDHNANSQVPVTLSKQFLEISNPQEDSAIMDEASRPDCD